MYGYIYMTTNNISGKKYIGRKKPINTNRLYVIMVRVDFMKINKIVFLMQIWIYFTK